MKRTFFLFTTLMILTLGHVFATEPCKGVLVPAGLSSDKVVFEIPDYEEYVHAVVLASFSWSEPLDDNKILDEKTYNKVRKNQIAAIQDGFKGKYVISNRENLANIEGISFLFQQELIYDLVSATSVKFENYTAFSIKDMNSSTVYNLVDPSQDDSANCIVKKEDYKFAELIDLVQK